MTRARASSLLLAGLVLLAVALRPGDARPPGAPARPAPGGWGRAPLAIAYIGHATVLLGMGGTHVLTDPALFERVGVSVGGLTVGPARVVAAALGPEDLPAPAAVVVTHAHFDSLDLPSLEALPRSATLIAPTGCGDLLGDLGFRAYVELAWGERVVVDGLAVEAVPVSHWGRRFPWGRERGYNGYLFEKDGMRVLFAPDTAYTPTFARFADGDRARLDLAVLGNGAYDPWVRNHATPEQVWQMFVESGARRLAPVHWDTFRLGREPLGDAMRRLRAAAGERAGDIVIDEIGDEWIAPPEEDAS